MSKDPNESQTIENPDDNQIDTQGTSSKSQKIQTTILSDTTAEPMLDRDATDGFKVLSEAWQIEFRISDLKKIIPLKPRILVGRTISSDSDTQTHQIHFDLTPFGAYHFGVSRHHAVMTLAGGYLYLEDLGSTNGTRINGFQLTANQPYRMRNGDEVEFGRLRTNIIFLQPDA